MSSPRLADRTPAVGLVGMGAVSVQFGAALATRLFDRVGPAGAATLRLVVAAVVLMAIAAWSPGGWRRVHTDPADLRLAVLFGLVLAAMNLSFYEALARVPLGVAVTVEFSGPLLLALAGSKRLAHGLWAVLAAAGVVLLGAGVGRGLDAAGLGLALLAGAFWIGYILLGKQTGQRLGALNGLAIAMAAGAVGILPVGVVAGGAGLLSPGVIGLGTAVALLSSVVPYTAELMALRRVTARAFGVMMSLDPALAAAAGWLVLGQRLTDREWVALGLVMVANLGNSLVGARTALQEPGSSVAA